MVFAKTALQPSERPSGGGYTSDETPLIPTSKTWADTIATRLKVQRTFEILKPIYEDILKRKEVDVVLFAFEQKNICS